MCLCERIGRSKVWLGEIARKTLDRSDYPAPHPPLIFIHGFGEFGR